jgi:hypothetical protein
VAFSAMKKALPPKIASDSTTASGRAARCETSRGSRCSSTRAKPSIITARNIANASGVRMSDIQERVAPVAITASTTTALRVMAEDEAAAAMEPLGSTTADCPRPRPLRQSLRCGQPARLKGSGAASMRRRPWPAMQRELLRG